MVKYKFCNNRRGGDITEKNIKSILNSKGIDLICAICSYNIIRTSKINVQGYDCLLAKCSKCHHIMWFDEKELSDIVKKGLDKYKFLGERK